MTAITEDALNQFRDLAAEIKNARDRAETRKGKRERFNLFTILLKAEDEVRLHTRFLHCLLNPEGDHNFGGRFLDLFFATLSEIPGLDHKDNPVPLEPPLGGQSWTVTKETNCSDYGRIDLLLEQPGFGIAIENKIYASEQKDQVARYAEYLRSKHVQGPVIFLTLSGRNSTTAGIDVSYVRISYSRHVLDWLERCLRITTPSDPVYLALRQYRSVVGQLTGNFLLSEDMKPISEFVRENPDIVRYRTEVANAIDRARLDFLDRLADGIIVRLTEKGYAVDRRDKARLGKIGLNPWAFIIIPLPTSNLGRMNVRIWVEDITSYGVLGVGIKFPVLPTEHQPLLDRMNTILDQDFGPESRESRPNPAWPTGWHKLIAPFDDNQLACLFERDLTEIVDEKLNAICSHIELIEKTSVKAASPI